MPLPEATPTISADQNSPTKGASLYLPASSLQYRYHRATWDGAPVQVAASALGVRAATAHKWQRRLREKAADALGVPVEQVNYIRALRCLFEGQEK